MALAAVSLDDKYVQGSGQVYMSGMQALVRLPILQRQRDFAHGLNTAGFISGYRGSPIGGYDKELWRARKFLEEHHIKFQPGLNEDIAATSIWGSQQITMFDKPKYDGVFGIWYGKGPGVDRSGDAIRHANSAGTSKYGGVLCIAGDDHTGKSSAFGVQSEFSFVDWQMPVLAPSSVQDFLDFGLYGFALSRFSGLWVGFKLAGSIAESSATVAVNTDFADFLTPDFEMPPDGLHLRWPDQTYDQERRVKYLRLPAAAAFARVNPIDRLIFNPPQARLGIVTVGKAYVDVRQALKELGIGEAEAHRFGIRLYKVGLAWPLEREGAKSFARGLEQIIVVEEKRALVESQLKEILYDAGVAPLPRIVGKQDEQGNLLFASTMELDSLEVAQVLGRRIQAWAGNNMVGDKLADIDSRIAARSNQTALARTAFFCAGCPHNNGTKLPDGSTTIGGIGCHTLSRGMNRGMNTFTHMGGEGASWIGISSFIDMKHIFQNMGDGGYTHSGYMGIRAAIAAGSTITFKILYNDAVAMTGGQPVEGQITVPQITRQMAAEGVKTIAVVSDEPDKYPADAGFAPGVTIHHRDDYDAVQRRFRELPGVTAIIYDQTCAAEKRRRRKVNKFPDPPRRVVINELVCEGCGDCGKQANCVAIAPLDTEFGRKRQIDQSSCNKDFSCLKGFCPSFVTVEGGKLRAQKGIAGGLPMPPLPEPALPAIDGQFGVLVSGVGGTGVVTIGALIGMAAHLEGKATSINDITGMAQKGGPVFSHIVIARSRDDIAAVRLAAGEVDTLVGCDLVVSAMPDVAGRLTKVSRGVVNTQETMTGAFTANPDLEFPAARMESTLRAKTAPDALDFIDATRIAAELVGDSIGTNLFLLGFAWQKGWIPLTRESLEEAVRLNKQRIDDNLRAFYWGRRLAHDPTAVDELVRDSLAAMTPVKPKTLDDSIALRVDFLTQYQDKAYAVRYRRLVDVARAAEASRAPGFSGFGEAVARYAFKLMAYKDEYEVARLYTDGSFKRKIAAQFEGDFKLNFYLSPPVLAMKDPNTGLARKRRFGPWTYGLFTVLAKMRFLRGSKLDVFGYNPERRMERALVREYEARIVELAEGLTPENHALAVEIASLPEQIRGYGHVKDDHLKKVRAREPALLATWRRPAGRPAAAQ